MKVLHLLGQHPSRTGSGTSFRAIISGLNQFGHDQHAIYGLNADHTPEEVGCPATPVIFEKKIDGFPLFGMSDLMPYETKRFCDMTESDFVTWSEKFLRTFLEVTAAGDFDVIISHHLHLLTAVVARHTHIPVVGVSHGTDQAQLSRNPHHLRYVKDALKDIPLIVTNAHDQSLEIAAQLGTPIERIKVLGGGYDPSFFYPGEASPPPPYRIVYSGKISEHKGLRPLFYALANLKKDTDFILTIAGTGKGEETDELIALGERLALPIVYTGFLNQKELGELYRTQHLFVLPSYAEGLSLATIEAIGAGLACVVTHLPNLIAFLPKNILDSGQILFTESFSQTPLKEQDPAFHRLVTVLEESVKIQLRKMLTLKGKWGTIRSNEITWFGRVELLNAWISDIIPLIF